MALKPAGVRGYEHTPAAAAVDSGVEQCSRVRISEPYSNLTAAGPGIAEILSRVKSWHGQCQWPAGRRRRRRAPS